MKTLEKNPITFDTFDIIHLEYFLHEARSRMEEHVETLSESMSKKDAQDMYTDYQKDAERMLKILRRCREEEFNLIATPKN